MHLGWSNTWQDIIETASEILSLTEARLNVLIAQQRQRSTDVLGRVRNDLANNPDHIRRYPHNWGTLLANAAIRVARRMPKGTADDREAAARLANFCGIVFHFRRGADPDRYEGLFRDSLEIFLRARLPDLVSNVIAADLVDEVQTWLNGFYERVPRDLAFFMNDILLEAYEARRKQLDTPETHGLMLRFVEDNRDLINLPVSEAQEEMRKRWEDLYTRHTGEPLQSPQQRLLSSDVRSRIKAAVERNDPLAVRDVIAPLEAQLMNAVRRSLDASFDVREPGRTVRDRSGQPLADFEAARRQIRRNNRQAVVDFRTFCLQGEPHLFPQSLTA